MSRVVELLGTLRNQNLAQGTRTGPPKRWEKTPTGGALGGNRRICLEHQSRRVEKDYSRTGLAIAKPLGLGVSSHVAVDHPPEPKSQNATQLRSVHPFMCPSKKPRALTVARFIFKQPLLRLLQRELHSRRDTGGSTFREPEIFSSSNSSGCDGDSHLTKATTRSVSAR